MTARQKIQAARTALVLDQPFFGALALRLKVVEDAGCTTAWTDGASLGYNPDFVMRLTHDEVVAVICHEVMHNACGHPWRRDGREIRRANIAMDLAINPILGEAGFRLPAGALLDQQYIGKSFEWIYARLPDQPPRSGSGKPGSGKGRGQDQEQGKGQASAPNSPGAVPGAGACDVRDAPADEADGASEADWHQAVQQAAAAAKGRGKLPASLARLAEDAAQPKVDWRSVLHRFVQQAAREDYSWTRPNPRYLAGGLYLPALHNQTVGPIAVAIDTSGSIDGVLLKQFAAELQSVVDDVRPARIHVLWCDAKVHRVDTFERDDELALKPVGGGGTAFAPVMDACEALDEPPVCLVYLTDLDGSHRQQPPEFPVLWAATQRRDVPYGEVVMVE